MLLKQMRDVALNQLFLILRRSLEKQLPKLVVEQFPEGAGQNHLDDAQFLAGQTLVVLLA